MRDIVYIIAGGPSLTGFSFEQLDGYDTIVVNKALYHVKNPTYFVTMDYSFMLKETGAIQSLPATCSKIFVAALDVPYLVEKDGIITDMRNKIKYDLASYDVIIKSKQKEGLGRSWNTFCNGWNSGYCALQFAVLIGYQRIVLLGIDLTVTKQTHFHGGYGEPTEKFQKKLQGYLNSFKLGLSMMNGQKAFNCSKDSALKDILGYTTFEETLEWHRQPNRF